MEREFGISRGDVEAAEAETARKLAADRAVELESPALRTYVSENPDADMTLLKFMDELKTRSDLAVQESRQQVNALREQVVQMRQNLKPTTQGAAYDHSDWVNAPSARSWHLYHVLHGQIDFGDAETAYYSSETI